MKKVILSSDSRIYIAGHRGMVGSAVMRFMQTQGYRNLIVADRSAVDLRDQRAVEHFFKEQRPDCVIFAAAKVGGIQANIRQPADFLFDNLLIQNNVISSSRLHGVGRFVFLGSSCIYPKECPQPMREEYLLTGPLEPTNEGYALAKIAGLKLTQFLHRQYGFQSLNLMPCNLYGPNDSFDLEHSHVLSALVRRFVDASAQGQPEVKLWGTGAARREFMHVDDLARAVHYFLTAVDPHQDLLNVGPGTDISIRELASLVAGITHYNGTISWDHTKPDGMMRKCMDVTRMKFFGFSPEISIETGIAQMIDNYKATRSL